MTLYERTQTGEDDFGAAVYSETPVTVHNVLVGEPETADLVNELQLYGKRLAYVLAIPKGDTMTGRARRSRLRPEVPGLRQRDPGYGGHDPAALEQEGQGGAV